MKNALYLLMIAALFSCQQPAPQERSIGFWTAEPGFKWHLGTEEAIQVVKELDKVWAAEDWTTMRTFFVDTAKFYLSDGKSLKSPDEFIELQKKQSELAETTWTFDYAFSVDLNPAEGGEHVQAGFTVTTKTDSTEVKTYYQESYYIIQGKVVSWNQSKAEEEKE